MWVYVYDRKLHIVLESCVTLIFSMHKMDFYIANLHIKKDNFSLVHGCYMKYIIIVNVIWITTSCC